jgi:hypothetical protein
MACRRTSAWALAALAALAAGTWWSCGGSTQTVTAPIAVSNAGDESGGVTAAAAAKVTVCQNGKTLQVAQSALSALRADGAILGSCAAPQCPCFTSATIASVAATCSGPNYVLDVWCVSGHQYSIQLSCAAGGVGVSMSRFEAVVGTDVCSTTSLDSSWNEVTKSMAVWPVELEACQQAIISSRYYPTGCPTS